jgi:transposase
MALAERYVNAAVGAADLSEVRRLAIDETSRAKGHDYVTVFADESARKVIYVAEGNDARANSNRSLKPRRQSPRLVVAKSARGIFDQLFHLEGSVVYW